MDNQAEDEKQKPFYKTWWGVLIVIGILPIFLIWFIWKKTNWEKWVKILSTVGLVVLVLLVYSPLLNKDNYSITSDEATVQNVMPDNTSPQASTTTAPSDSTGTTTNQTQEESTSSSDDSIIDETPAGSDFLKIGESYNDEGCEITIIAADGDSFKVRFNNNGNSPYTASMTDFQPENGADRLLFNSENMDEKFVNGYLEIKPNSSSEQKVNLEDPGLLRIKYFHGGVSNENYDTPDATWDLTN